MALKDEIKARIKRQGWTLTDVANEMTKVTGKKYYCAYLSRRINNETINYKEMKILCKIIGCKINIEFER